ncbi:MAG TPA: hypothetical protein VFV75_05880 [Candidatus Polarisedimenticolaceae bacterium]|nr:hypothetical protein [Candidatus Polarisedimenticolaceae bacterium]
MVPRRLQLAVATAAIVAAAVLAFLVTAPAERLVDYLSDDAFYYLRVASHLAAGDGPTFDGITRTTGFHPLYALVLAGLDRIVREDGARLAAALAVNALAFAAAALLLAAAAGTLWGPRGAWLSALAWLTNPHALLLPFTGMEGTLCAAAFAGLLWALARRSMLAVAAFLALCVLARTDGLLLVPLCFAALALQGTWRQAMATLAAIAPYALWVVYTHAEGAQAVHGSADVKRLWRSGLTAPMDWLEETWFSLRIFLVWVGRSLVKVPLLHWFLPWVGRAFHPRPLVAHLAWLFPAGLGIAYALLLPRAWTWYYAPAIAGLTLLAAGTLARMERLHAALLLLAAIESYGYLGFMLAHGRNREQRDMLRAARWVAAHVPPESRVGAWNAGIYSWYSAHTVINLDGLINDEIAPWIRAGKPMIGYLDRRGIDVVVDYDEIVRQLPPERVRPLAHFESAWEGKPISVVRLAR